MSLTTSPGSGGELSELSLSNFPSLDLQLSNLSSTSSSSASPAQRLSRPNLVTVPHRDNQSGALQLIEGLLESIAAAICNNDSLEIPYRRARPPVFDDGEEPQNEIMFPGRTDQEASRFEALFRIIELSHEALLSGNVITKRNMYYQDIKLFTSQSIVDEMVDNLAFTLGVGREDLNIVATAKGLISGPIDLFMREGDMMRCGLPSKNGTLLPPIGSVEKVDFAETNWILVIEKEATFRTLVAAQYANSSTGGPGILITGKGYPDLATRRFLHTLHAMRPQINIFALVDFDPPGIAILRNFQYGSKRLKHEENSTVPDIKWLGIRSSDLGSIFSQGAAPRLQESRADESDSQSTQDTSSQESISYSQSSTSSSLAQSGASLPTDFQEEPPRKRRRVEQTTRDSTKTISPLTQADRKRAIETMNDIHDTKNTKRDAEQLRELQRMLMMNIKAEIQAVDHYGDITDWLNEKLRSHLG